MKILFSQIQKLVPGLKAEPKEVADVLTNIGFLNDSLEEASFNGQKDFLIGLEIRQNRADLLSYWGVAREVAAYYGLTLAIPEVKINLPEADKTGIQVNGEKWVKRIMAVDLVGVKQKESPAWLKELLTLHGTKSINLAVDLSNYVMFLTGYPSHLLDREKITGHISWSLNKNFKEITTLDGTRLELKGNELIIEDEKNILALAGLVGGQSAMITEETTSVLLEMAVYERSLVKKNARDLKITTEAGLRLEKTLDPNGLETAFKLLISLLLEQTGAKMEGTIFKHYPLPVQPETIDFCWAKAGAYAGIPINKEQCLTILKNLRFTVKDQGEILTVTAPNDRTDIFLEEDVIEEVIRIVGYEKIPWNETPKLEVVKEITPAVVKTKDSAGQILISLGLDEILSLPLVPAGSWEAVNYRDKEAVITQNAINEERPELRQSLATGMLEQLVQFKKNNVTCNFFFEIGKIFGKDKKESDFWETEALGILLVSKKQHLNKIKTVTEKFLSSIGLDTITYNNAPIKPPIAHPDVCFTVMANKKELGVIYKLAPEAEELTTNVYFAELDLELVTAEALKNKANPAVEITTKLVSLDANLEASNQAELEERMAKIAEEIGETNLWNIEVVDTYQLKEKFRHTVRTVYQNLSDQEAKKIHLNVFGLTQ